MFPPAAPDGAKQILWGIEFTELVGKMVGDGNVVVMENPDDAALKNAGTGVAVTWPCDCRAR